MNLQGAPAFSPDDYPDVPEQLLQRLTEAFDELYAAIGGVKSPTVAESKSFTTGAGGTAYLDLKTDAKPSALWVGKLSQDGGTEITAVYSQTFIATKGGVRLLFAGLAASTKHTCSVVYL